MNVLFDINHPAHVHLFKNAIYQLKKEGHHIVITARDKDVTLQLLDSYNLPYHCLSKARHGLLGLGIELLVRQWRLIPILIKHNINVCISATGACNVHICKILGIPTLVFYDTEHATLQNNIAIPFMTKYFTPEYYDGKRAKNQVTYKGVHELAYLHPNYFKPSLDILSLLGVSDKDRFIMIRFVAWQASHDIGQQGISLSLKRKLIQQLSPLAKIFIVSESPLPAEFQPYGIKVPPERIHDALSYATLFIGEGATMASECACLGTPAIYLNSLKLGYITAENKKYGLIFDMPLDHEENIIQQAKHVLSMTDSAHWMAKRNRFLEDHIDVTQYIIHQILNDHR